MSEQKQRLTADALEALKADLRARNILVGKKFGRVEVVGELGNDKFLAHCEECGREYEATAGDIMGGADRGCGCDLRHRERLERARKSALRVALATYGAVGLVLLVFLGIVLTYPRTTGGKARGVVEFDVAKGSGARQVAALLAAKGLIRSPGAFRLYASQRGVASKFKAGHYKVEAPLTPRALADALLKGAIEEQVIVTIPEGKTVIETGALLEGSGITSGAELVAKAQDPAFARSLAVHAPSLEGYLFPDTYKFRPHSPAGDVLAAMVRRHRQVFDELKARHAEGAAGLKRSLGFDDQAIVTLASIVEKETGQPGERPRIAQVFLNRLEKPSFQPKLLQTDPTIIYGCTSAPGPKSAACAKWDGRIRRIQLEDRENPYNTYTHPGLPPGPIANPGRAALEAVLAPDGTGYLYFVSRNDGTHFCSSTIADHEAAVDKYQRSGRAGAGKASP